jgi:hypothetical protein
MVIVWCGRCQTNWAIIIISIITICIAWESSLCTSILLCNKCISWTLPVVRRTKQYIDDAEIYFSIAVDNKALCSYGRPGETLQLKWSLTSSAHGPEVKWYSSQKSWTVPMSFVMPVCPSVIACMDVAPHCTDLCGIWCWELCYSLWIDEMGQKYQVFDIKTEIGLCFW